MTRNTSVSARLIVVGETNLQERSDPAAAFRHLVPTLRGADLVVAQLEGLLAPPSTDAARPDNPYKDGWRHSDPDMVRGLLEADVGLVSCASNVAYPPDAVVRSIETLERVGLAWAGIGRDAAEARRPAVVERAGLRVGLLSYTSVFWPTGHAAGPASPGVATLKAHTAFELTRRALEMPGLPPTVRTRPDDEDLAAMEADVRALRERVDVVLVSCHWGVSNSTSVAEYQRIAARAAVAAGADLVFGHHPHVVQEVEVVDGVPVFYSLGNFVFDWHKMRGRNLDGLLLTCDVEDGALAHVAVSFVRRDETNDVRPVSADDAAFARRADDLIKRSAGNGTRLTVAGDGLVVEGLRPVRSIGSTA